MKLREFSFSFFEKKKLKTIVSSNQKKWKKAQSIVFRDDKRDIL